MPTEEVVEVIGEKVNVEEVQEGDVCEHAPIEPEPIPGPATSCCNTLSVQSFNTWRGNSLMEEKDPPVEVHMEKKGNLHTGWMRPYLVVGDSLFGNGRWMWWLEAILSGSIPEGPLPQISFIDSSSLGEAKETRKHIQGAVEHLFHRYGSWESFNIFLDWLMWSIGEGNFPERLSDEDHDWLYRYLQMGRLQKAPHDYFGEIISERLGNGSSWNPTAFFPTPETVVKFMVEMQFGDGGEKGKFTTVCDPAVGTARMLMHASNHSIFLFGADIDPVVLKAAKLNLHLYAPWGALPIRHIEEAPFYEITPEVQRIASARYLQALQMFEELRAKPRPDVAQVKMQQDPPANTEEETPARKVAQLGLF